MTARNRKRIEVHNLAGELIDAQDTLEELTDGYTEAEHDTAEAEDAFNRVYHRRMVELADHDHGLPKAERRTVDHRESLAMQTAATEHGVLLIRQAALKAWRARLKTADRRVEAVRTLMATERQFA
jgi:hypothetical protein